MKERDCHLHRRLAATGTAASLVLAVDGTPAPGGEQILDFLLVPRFYDAAPRWPLRAKGPCHVTYYLGLGLLISETRVSPGPLRGFYGSTSMWPQEAQRGGLQMLPADPGSSRP